MVKPSREKGGKEGRQKKVHRKSNEGKKNGEKGMMVCGGEKHQRKQGVKTSHPIISFPFLLTNFSMTNTPSLLGFVSAFMSSVSFIQMRPVVYLPPFGKEEAKNKTIVSLEPGIMKMI